MENLELDALAALDTLPGAETTAICIFTIWWTGDQW